MLGIDHLQTTLPGTVLQVTSAETNYLRLSLLFRVDQASLATREVRQRAYPAKSCEVLYQAYTDG